MKSLAACAGQKKSLTHKQSTNESAARYWGTCHNFTHRLNPATGNYEPIPRKFTRSDGSVSVDKTKGWHSRPGHKEQIRNANRAVTKRARQILKRNIDEELESH